MTTSGIFGRDAELDQLRQLLRRQSSFLLHGPSGVGKTLLIRHLAAEKPEMLYCGDSSGSQAVFRCLTAELLARNDPTVVKSCGRNGESAIQTKSSVALRGIVTKALAENRYCLALDHAQVPTLPFARALKELSSSSNSPLLVIARSAHMEDAGFLLPMFPDRTQRVGLRNFNSITAMEFATQASERMRLKAANRDQAIEKIVEYSKGNPGGILAMLKMAADSRYVSHEHIKLAPLYIDYRLSRGPIYG
jgi:DNA polymerase III delta prime subunit